MAFRRASHGPWLRFGLVLNALIVLSLLLSPVSVALTAPQPKPALGRA